MKKLRSIVLSALFALVITCEVQAQTVSPKLNQFELNKQFLGSWKAINGDEITTIECKLFYNGIETHYKTEKKGKIVVENKLLLGYDKKLDKLIECGIGSDVEGIMDQVAWFTSNTKMEEILLEDMPHPDKPKLKSIFEFKSPDVFTLTTERNSKIVEISTFNRTQSR
jgi:hypothetical protein